MVVNENLYLEDIPEYRKAVRESLPSDNFYYTRIICLGNIKEKMADE